MARERFQRRRIGRTRRIRRDAVAHDARRSTRTAPARTAHGRRTVAPARRAAGDGVCAGRAGHRLGARRLHRHSARARWPQRPRRVARARRSRLTRRRRICRTAAMTVAAACVGTADDAAGSALADGDRRLRAGSDDARASTSAAGRRPDRRRQHWPPNVRPAAQPGAASRRHAEAAADEHAEERARTAC